jgi:hypothetical protein
MTMKVQGPRSKVQTQRGGKPGSGDRTSHFSPLTSHLQIAFTILEVMVACTIFFMVAFAILELVTRSLAAAKAIQRREPDPGIILAMYSTNRAWEETSVSGNYEDIAPGMYPGYRWELFAKPVGTNDHLYEVNVMSYNERQPALGPMVVSGLFFSPQSKPGSASKGLF